VDVVLPESETLSTVAEVGIAITGFAGIIVAIGHRSDSERSADAEANLRNLVGASLGTVFFSFVPVWLNATISSPDAVWQVSNGAYGVYRLSYLAFIILSIRRRDAPLFVFERTHQAITLPLGIALGVSHLIAAMGFLREFHYFIYLTGLFWGLGIGLLSFSRLLSDQTESDAPAA
jgi:hypothetical protein